MNFSINLSFLEARRFSNILPLEYASDHVRFIDRIAVANADLALERGEVDSALNILRMIGPEQIYFIQVFN